MTKLKSIIKNVSYTISSNFLALLVSTIITLFLPKVLGVESYGYYQLYLFYVSYVGFLHFGWCDGIYLRYGGKHYDELNYTKFRGQYISLLIMELIISFILLMLVLFSNIANVDKIFVLIASVLNIVILNLRTFSVLILQATNRMKDYSIITIMDRIIFITMAIFLMLFGYKQFYMYIVVDIIAKLISLLIAMYKTKEITLYLKPIQFSIKEDIKNISIGINLMLANIASTMIIGIVRFGVQWGWSIEVFGKVSLTLSISNMLMVFINAISLAIFPLLKRENTKDYAKIYNLMRTILMPTVLCLLISYYPLKILLSLWLPEYSESIKYMGIVFPMVVFESKVSLLSNTYLKALRREKSILLVNIVTVIISLFLTFISVKLIKSIPITMVLIVLLLAFRSMLSEIILSRTLGVSIYKDLILEMLIVLIFIYYNWNVSLVSSFFIYAVALIFYFIFKKKDLIRVKESFLNLKNN